MADDMDRHPSARQLTEYLSGESSAADFLEVHHHLLTCPRCAEAYAPTSRPADDYSTLREALVPEADEAPFHLTYRDAQSYALGRSDRIDTEIAETHLEACPDCARVVSDLREIKARVTEDVPARRNGLPPLSAAPAYRNAFQTLRRHPLKIAASVVVLVGIVAALLLQGGRERSAREPLAGSQSYEPPAASSTGPPQNTLPSVNQEQTKLNGDSNAASAPRKSEPPKSHTRHSKAPIVLNDGGRLITLAPGGELRGLPPLPRDLQRAVAAALISGSVEIPREVADLRGSHSVLLGEADDGVPFRLLSPVGVITPDERPLLRWRSLPGASSYTVAVADANYDEVVTSEPLTGSQWKVPVPLIPGKTYAWQVTAMKDGKSVTSPAMPAPPAKFKVVDRATGDALRSARRRYGDSHLILGVLYARAGLLEEASREFRTLSETNPGSVVIPKLLQIVR